MKKLVVFISLLLCVVLLMGSVLVYHNDLVCAQTEKLFFGMTKSYVKWTQGKPSSAEINQVTGNLDWHYEQTKLCGYPAVATYTFHKSLGIWRLFDVTYTVYDLDQSNGLTLFHQLNDTNSKLYGERENYYHQAVEDTLETNGTISTSFGTNNGATGVSAHIQYENGVLVFNIIIQE